MFWISSGQLSKKRAVNSAYGALYILHLAIPRRAQHPLRSWADISIIYDLRNHGNFAQELVLRSILRFPQSAVDVLSVTKTTKQSSAEFDAFLQHPKDANEAARL